MNLLRRTFLKASAGVALAAAAMSKGLTLLDEPELLIADSHKDWIEDKGDFYIVRVPDYKTFARETLDKPTILLLGENSTAKDLDIDGYLNVEIGNYSHFLDSRIDSSKYLVSTGRPVVNIQFKVYGLNKTPTTGASVTGLYATGNVYNALVDLKTCFADKLKDLESTAGNHSKWADVKLVGMEGYVEPKWPMWEPVKAKLTNKK